jgi:hypothetical protein
MRVFRFHDSETHTIAAPDEAKAREFYFGCMNEDGAENYTVHEIPCGEWAARTVRDDDVPGGKTTVQAIVDAGPTDEAFLVCSTVW